MAPITLDIDTTIDQYVGQGIADEIYEAISLAYINLVSSMDEKEPQDQHPEHNWKLAEALLLRTTRDCIASYQDEKRTERIHNEGLNFTISEQSP
jgi:hypothetical protein